jgi:hypothetical protein
MLYRDFPKGDARRYFVVLAVAFGWTEDDDDWDVSKG